MRQILVSSARIGLLFKKKEQNVQQTEINDVGSENYGINMHDNEASKTSNQSRLCTCA